MRFNLEYKIVNREIKISQPKAIKSPCLYLWPSQAPGGRESKERSGQQITGLRSSAQGPGDSSVDLWAPCAFLKYKGKNII